MLKFIAVTAFCSFTLSPALADSAIVGRASVIDGDTVDIHGSRIRLASIDAPESAQLCDAVGGKTWRCGQRAALGLSDFISSAPLRCAPSGRDRYRRILARCFSGDVDVNRWLIEQGWAIRYYDDRGLYRAAEQTARQEQRGIWSGRFTRPSDWRKTRR